MTTTDYPKIGLYIDGEWIYDRPACTEVSNPSTEDILALVPSASDADLQRALEAAERGFLIWRDTAPEARVKILRKAVALLRERVEQIGRIITLEQGKAFPDACAEVKRTSDFMEWNAEEALRAYGSVLPSEPTMQRLILRQPIGPVAAFTPWNVPIGSAGRKISAALAAGCSVILKPAVETPGAACAFVQAFIDAGLPEGVLNLVFGSSSKISSTLVASPVIRLVTLTGSVRVGKQVAMQAGAAMKPVVMELGGHAPVIIGEGVDADMIARKAAANKMQMAGQICISPSRFIVHRSVYEPFVSAFGEVCRSLKVGDGFDPDVHVGPLANPRRLAAVESLVDDARARGARIITGGHRIGARGCFYAPTVIADVTPDAAAMIEEPFGPLALCVAVDTLDEAIKLANSLPVGLAAYAFTNSLHDARRIARELESGVVSINHLDGPGPTAPFGGVKDSGIGREGGVGSLDAYLLNKTVLEYSATV